MTGVDGDAGPYLVGWLLVWWAVVAGAVTAAVTVVGGLGGFGWAATGLEVAGLGGCGVWMVRTNRGWETDNGVE